MSYPSSPRRARLIAFAITLGAMLLVASTWRYFGQTWDEPEHLAAGLELLEHDRYVYDIQHPPLARVLIAIGPYLAGARSVDLPPPNGEPEGREILYGEGHYELFLTLARLGALPFLGLLLGATWWWTRVTGQAATGPLALGLLAATPPLLGHAGLASLDVASAATTLLGCCALLGWLERPRAATAALFGATMGVAVATKLSALPFLGSAGLVLWLLRAWVEAKPDATADAVTPATGSHPSRARRTVLTWAGQLALIALIAALILTLAYGGRFAYLTDPREGYAHAIDYLFGTHGSARDWARAFAQRVPLPVALPLLLGGIEAVQVHNASGHLSYLLGEVRTNGWWYFYLVALAVKLPLPLLALGVPGLAGLGVQGFRRRSLRLLATPALFCTILAFCSLFSHINLGLRHVLILLPWLAVGAAWLAAAVWGFSARQAPALRTGLRTVLVALVIWQVSSLPRAYPDYLAYFNEAVAHPERVLVDSDLDWGQDLRRLEQRARELALPQLGLAYLGSADLRRERLPPFTVLRPGQPASGWVAINELARVQGGQAYRWLDRYQPRERIGKTIDLYYIEPEVITGKPSGRAARESPR